VTASVERSTDGDVEERPRRHRLVLLVDADRLTEAEYDVRVFTVDPHLSLELVRRPEIVPLENRYQVAARFSEQVVVRLVEPPNAAWLLPLVAHPLVFDAREQITIGWTVFADEQLPVRVGLPENALDAPAQKRPMFVRRR
jgi:hypothetical protein